MIIDIVCVFAEIVLYLAFYIMCAQKICGTVNSC